VIALVAGRRQAPGTGHAEVGEHGAGGRGEEQVLGAPADGAERLAGEPARQVGRDGGTQITPGELDACDHRVRADQALQAGAHGLDLGQFGHGRGSIASAPAMPA
jgi:hypothetical protein